MGHGTEGSRWEGRHFPGAAPRSPDTCICVAFSGLSVRRHRGTSGLSYLFHSLGFQTALQSGETKPSRSVSLLKMPCHDVFLRG